MSEPDLDASIAMDPGDSSFTIQYHLHKSSRNASEVVYHRDAGISRSLADLFAIVVPVATSSTTIARIRQEC